MIGRLRCLLGVHGPWRVVTSVDAEGTLVRRVCSRCGHSCSEDVLSG